MKNILLSAIIAGAFSMAEGQGLSRISIHCDSDSLAPKSIITNNKGLFFTQNMMYTHYVGVFNQKGEVVKYISDSVQLTDFGYMRYPGSHQGAPVEACANKKGTKVWVSNYQMYGEKFDNPGEDDCIDTLSYDPSFVYEIDVQSLEIADAIMVGSVPKYLALSKDESKLLVSNWCSGSLSVVNLNLGKQTEEIPLKGYPRGIAVNPINGVVYVAQMGTYEIAVVSLDSAKVIDSIRVPGRSPRHLCITQHGKYLYASINAAGTLSKYNLEKDSLEGIVRTGKAPRSMVLSKDGRYLYVVNYRSNTFSKVRTADFSLLESTRTEAKPIGVCFDDSLRNVWVSSYDGCIEVFHDQWYGNDSLYFKKGSTDSFEFTIIVGSFSNDRNAKDLVTKLINKGFDSFIMSSDKGVGRVCVGKFKSLGEAEDFQQEALSSFESWVFKLDREKF